jgi:hypothetical protein
MMSDGKCCVSLENRGNGALDCQGVLHGTSGGRNVAD